MDSSLVEIDNLITSAFNSYPDERNFPNLCHLLLQHRKYSELQILLSTYPDLKLHFIRIFLSFKESSLKLDLSDIHMFFSSDFLSEVDFSKFSNPEMVQIQNVIWESLLKNKLRDLQKISELFLKFSIKIQIAPVIRSSLLISAINTLRPRIFEIMLRRGFFQLDDEHYNGLIHLIEAFPKNCARIFNDLLIGGYPKLYESNMRNVLLSIYMQEKFTAEEKIKLFRELSEKISNSDMKELIFAIDANGNHLMSAVVSSRNINLLKETIKLIKKLTTLKTTHIINKCFEDYESFELLKNKEYQKYMESFTNKRIKNPNKYSRFLPINLIEAAITVKFSIIITYLLKKKYNLQAPTRSGLRYIELLVFLATNLSSQKAEEEDISEILSILYDAKVLRPQEENLVLSFNYFEENILIHFQNNSRPPSGSPSRQKKSISIHMRSKEKIIEILAILDSPDLFIRLFPPIQINPESKSFCYYYILTICQCIHHRAIKILRTLSEHSSVRYLIENVASIFSYCKNVRPDIFSEFFLENDQFDDDLQEVVNDLFDQKKGKEQKNLNREAGNKMNYISMFTGMGYVAPEDASDIIFSYLKDSGREWDLNYNFLLDNLKIYEKIYKFRISDVKSIKAALICKSINFLIINNFEESRIQSFLNELIRLDFVKYSLMLLEDEVQNYFYDSLGEILKKFLIESLKRSPFEGKYRIFEEFYYSLESTVVVSICSRRPEISMHQLDWMTELNFDSFELLWKQQNLESVNLNTLFRLMQLCKDSILYTKLFDMALSEITEEKDEELENSENQIESNSRKDFNFRLKELIFQLVDLYKLKGGDDSILERIRIASSTSTYISILKSAVFLQKINNKLEFVSVMKLDVLINHISANIKLYQSQDSLFKEAVSYLFIPLNNHKKQLTTMKQCKCKFINALIELNHKKALIERISECEVEDVIFLIKTLNFSDILNMILLYYAYNCMKTRLFSILNQFQINSDTLQNLNFYAAYGRNWHKHCLRSEKLNIPANCKSRPLMQETIVLETTHSFNFLITLGLLGDLYLLEIIKDCKDLNLLVEICFSTIKGYDHCKRFCLEKRVESLKGFKKILNFFVQVFESNSLESVKHEHVSSEIIEICIKNKLIKLLICLIPLLKTENKKYSKFLYLKVSMSNLKLKKKIEKIKKMRDVGLSPVEFFQEAIEKNLTVLRNIKIVIFFLETFKDLHIFINDIMKCVGKIKVMEYYNCYSELGLCRYGKQHDMERYLQNFPEIINRVPEFCKEAIKSRNSPLISFLIEKMSKDQCLELISSNNCEILFHMAFYCLDSELCMIIYQIGSDSLLTYKSNTLYEMSIFSIRIMNGPYSKVWEPLNGLLDDISINSGILMVYLKKILEYNTGILLSFNTQVEDDLKPLELIDFIHSIIISQSLETIKKICPLIIGMNLIPSVSFIENIKQTQILNLYLNFLYENYSYLNLPHSAQVWSDFFEYKEIILENSLLKLAHLGDKNLNSYQISCELNSKIIRQLFVNGKFALYLYRSLHFANENEPVDDDVWEFLHEDVKVPICLAIILAAGGDIKSYLLNILNEIENSFDLSSVFKFHKYLIKALEILGEYSAFLKYSFSIEQGAHSQIMNILKKIILKCKSKCQELQVKVRISKELTSLIPLLSQSENILFNSNLIICYATIFEYYLGYGIIKFLIETNKEIENIYQNIPKKIKISINVEKNYGKINFVSISSPNIFMIDKEVLKSTIETFSQLKIRLKMNEMPNGYQELEALKKYFEDESNSLYNLITFKCIYSYHSNFECDNPSSYPEALLADFQSFSIGDEVLLKEVKEIPLNCKETSTICFKLSEVQTEIKKITNQSTKELVLKFQLFDYTFYPFLLFNCYNKLKFLTFKFLNISGKTIEMNYNKFLKEVAFPVSDASKTNIITVIENFFLKLEPVLYYMSRGADFFDMSFILSYYIDFHFDSKNFKIYDVSEITVYSIPVISNSDNSMIDFIIPELEYVYEDHLQALYSPKEIFDILLDVQNFDFWLSSKKSHFKFMFILDWESIFQFFLNDFEFPNHRRTIRSLIKLEDDLDYSLILKDSLYVSYQDDTWDFAILLNSFSLVDDSFTIQKVTADEEFWKYSKNKYEKCFLYNTADKMFNQTKKITPEILSKATSLSIGLTSGIWNIPASALPTLDSNLQVSYPSIGNILQPFPDLLNISVNPEENPDILLKIKHYDGEFRKSEDHLIASFEVRPFQTSLRNFFWYSFSLNKSKISNYFLKSLNSRIKSRKTIFNEKNFKKSFRVMKKTFNWNPVFEITWNEFEGTKFEVNKGMRFAGIILDKIREFLEYFDLIYNSVGNFNAFYSFEGLLYVRPKRSLLRKVISRNIHKIIVKVTTEEAIESNENGDLELSLNPSHEHFSLSKELINCTLSSYILSSDKAKNRYPNVEIQDKNLSEISYLKMIEKLELYSQIPLILNFTKLASKLYFPEVPYKVVVRLDQWKKQYSVKAINCSTLRLTFGKLFYNKLNLTTFGEECCRQLLIYRPVNLVIIPRFIPCIYKADEKDANILIPVSESKSYSSRKLQARLVKITESSRNPDFLIVTFFRNFPVYYNFIGESSLNHVENRLKYDFFCMSEQKNSFNPIIKSSLYSKIKLDPEKYATHNLLCASKFTCFLFAYGEPSVIIHNNKNKSINYKLTKTENKTIWNDYQVYELVFEVSNIGHYYFYNKNLILPADFFINMVQKIDPANSTLEYKKLNNTFLLTFYDCNKDKIILKVPKNLPDNKKFNLNYSTISIRVFLNDMSECKHFLEFKMNTIIISYEFPSVESKIHFEVLIDDTHLINSPYVLESNSNFIERYEKFLVENKKSSYFHSEETLIIDRKSFFKSLKMSFPKGSSGKSGLYIHYENEQGVDVGGLKRDFYDCLGSYATLPNLKLFEKKKEFYRIHPESNPDFMESIGSAFANGIIHEYKVPIPLCNSLLKYVLGLKVEPSDLRDEDPDLYSSYQQILTMSEDELNSLYQYFSVQSNGTTVSLIPGGDKIQVTTANRENYFKLIIKWELKGYASQSIEKFVRGFTDVAANLKILRCDEIRFVMSGFDEKDAEFVKSNIIESNSKLTRVKLWLIEWLEQLELEDLKKFLKFSTGISMVPIKRENWKITLNKGNGVLPVSHTCFYTIDVPIYQTFEELCKRFRIAIDFGCEGFGNA